MYCLFLVELHASSAIDPIVATDHTRQNYSCVVVALQKILQYAYGQIGLNSDSAWLPER
jgi:hypothetical protein